MRDITDLYMNTSSLGYGYVGANGDQHCPKAQHVPCMVPQARDILNPEESILLKKCPTLWDYMCEMSVLMYAWKYGPSACAKPCKTWHYKSYDAGSTDMANYMPSNTMLLMSFASDTVLKDEERKVRVHRKLLKFEELINISLTAFQLPQIMDLPTIIGSVADPLGSFSDSHASPQHRSF